MLNQKPKAAILRLGDVINLNRPIREEDIQNWTKLMQVWGAYNPNLPHIPLSEARMRAHRHLY